MYRIGKEEIDAVARVIEQKSLFKINNKLQETMHAEEEMKALFGTKYPLLMTNGYAALTCALIGMGIGPGDEVIVPSYSFIASSFNKNKIFATAKISYSLTTTIGQTHFI